MLPHFSPALTFKGRVMFITCKESDLILDFISLGNRFLWLLSPAFRRLIRYNPK